MWNIWPMRTQAIEKKVHNRLIYFTKSLLIGKQTNYHHQNKTKQKPKQTNKK